MVDMDDPVWRETLSGYVQAYIRLRNRVGVPSRRNGLRHGFITFHFAMYSNEGLTAAQAGTSPTMIFQHYRGLATPHEAQRWFDVVPQRPQNVVLMASGH